MKGKGKIQTYVCRTKTRIKTTALLTSLIIIKGYGCNSKFIFIFIISIFFEREREGRKIKSMKHATYHPEFFCGSPPLILR